MEEVALASGLLELGVAADAGQMDQLERYRALLDKWNRASNLVSRRDTRRLVSRHLLDSVSILPWVRGERLVDLGSGGGLPGIPIAIMRPESQVTLLERSDKKCRFLSAAVRELALRNVQVVSLEAKLFRPAQAFQTLISRAVAPPAKIWELGLHLLEAQGRMVLHAHVGVPERTQLALPPGVQVKWEQVEVPGLSEAHEVLLLEEARY